MILVTGGSGSGKSEYAENLVVELVKNSSSYNKLLYVATMSGKGQEAERRIAKHRKMREGKGFETLESMYLENDISVFRECVVLIEDLSNLLSNYMFLKDDRRLIENKDISLVDIIHNRLLKIDSICQEMVIVTNEVFSDRISYDEAVMSYIKYLAILNNKLAKSSHQFVEVVYGIPVIIKEQNIVKN